MCFQPISEYPIVVDEFGQIQRTKVDMILVVCFLKRAIPGLFSAFTFGFFLASTTIFTTKLCEEMSILCWDSNPRPLEHESHHTITRPQLPPIDMKFILHKEVLGYHNGHWPDYRSKTQNTFDR